MTTAPSGSDDSTKQSPPNPTPPSSPTTLESFAGLPKDTAKPNPETLNIIQPSTFHGEPALKIGKEVIETFAKPFQLTLIGKFSHGRPTMETTRKVFTSFGLKGGFKIRHFDTKHIMITVFHDGDFQQMWTRETWYIDGFPMRVFRWTTSWRPDQESSLYPVCASLPSLPLHLMNKTCLFSLANLIGSPLSIDQPTATLSPPSLARVLVADVLPGFWQHVEYENLPHYCKFCSRLGHEISQCKAANPEAGKDVTNVEKSKPPKANPSQFTSVGKTLEKPKNTSDKAGPSNPNLTKHINPPVNKLT